MKIITIIVTYNGGRYIQQCLQCLRESVGGEVNHTIVVDNDSMDDTRDIIESEFPEVEMIRLAENLGFGKANNIGLREALKRNVDYVFLLNQDAYVMPETIVSLSKVARVHPEYGILSPIQLSGDGETIDSVFYPYSLCSCKELVSDLVVSAHELKAVYPVYFTPAAAWFISQDFLKKVGGFAPIYPHYGEDNDLINRCHFHGFKAGIVPEVSVRHDRPQAEKSFSEKPLATHTQEAYIRSLIILTNAGGSISGAFLLAVVRSVRNLIVGFHPKKCISESWSWCRIVKSSQKIMRTRAQNACNAASYIG